MKTTNHIKFLVSLSLVLLMSSNSKAQINSLEFIYGPTNDARILLQEYMRPYANILGANLNAGWYNTARTHKLGGIDVTAMVSLAFAPSTALQYDLRMVEGLTANIEGTDFAPTVAGSMEVRPDLVYNTQIVNGSGDLETHELARFTHPNGAGLDFLPLPMAQISVGLPLGTEITGRYVPSVAYKNYGEMGLWGVGGKHSISQWIPVIKKLKFIDISAQGGFTKVTSAAHLNLQPIGEVALPEEPDWDDQFLVMGITGWTVNLIASQTIPVITVYEGIGYSSSLVELAMSGHYPINAVVSDPNSPDFGKTTYTVEEDPIEDLTFENYKNLRLNAGIRLKLGVFTLHYDFTKTLYATHTAGFGISFR